MNDGIHMTENYIHYVFAFEFGNMSFIIQRYIFQNSNLHRFISFNTERCDGRY